LFPHNTFVLMFSTRFSSKGIGPGESHPGDWKIDMQDAWLVLWWCRQLGLTKSQLEHAVSVAGPLIDNIRNYVASEKSQELKPAQVASPSAANHLASRNVLDRSPF